MVTSLLASAVHAVNVGFVQPSGLQFAVDGQPYVYVGASYFNAMNEGSDCATHAALDTAFAGLQALGVTNVRIWASSEGPGGTNKLTPTLQPTAGFYDETLFRGLDYALKSANDHDLRCIMVLNNCWDWSGGMYQYVDWSPDTDKDRSKDYSWGQGPIHDQFYTDANCISTYRAFINAVVNRANTESGGLLYKDDPTIFSWELANEPRAHSAGQTVLSNWIDQTAAYIKSIDSNHMVSTGSEGFLNKTNPAHWWERSDLSGTDFVANHLSSNIDFATVHIWPWNWRWYPEQDPSIHNMTELYARCTQFLQEHITSSAGTLGKPLVLEEFGLLRDNDHDGNGSEPPGSPVTERNALFQLYFDMLYADALAGGASGGSNFWTYDGDPPQESEGMYSVYSPDDNSTLELIAAAAALMSGLIPARGDANRDGKVDGADLALWQRNFDPLGLGSNSWGDGDWNGDGKIDRADLALWQQNHDPLGVLGLEGMSAFDAVPEPASLSLVLAAALGFLIHHRLGRRTTRRTS